MSDLTLSPEQTACIFIEYQNEFTTEGGKLYPATKEVMEKTSMRENSVKLIEFCREKGILVLHCPIAFEPGHREISKVPYGILQGIKDGKAFERGDSGSDYYEPMKPIEGELVVKGKSGLCSFASTNLEFLLHQHGIKNVVLSGFLTNCCVESTMRTAYEKGFKVYTLKDCTAATSLAAHEASFEHNFGMFSVPTTSEEIKKAISVE
jgi:nicotinamidase-related amidase|uniref:Isochorismatase-like domain-containing protein n=1 Tax=Pseudo-nitzschia australis TaxID=44445 RepID=A0A7S4EE43_9STRA|mmetsp:Transcript_21730/g.45726  ORF Transcript_21730/g.45726 Transcript_21730/m.45726 type:complete len:207 (-) Transcript_21730:344-964(-)|eukprot:CAMPEP_0168170520 /NCGR_PEP_ID=MMETSP0139_2-20121125/4225_1 /TAXON_ID=44445 /ORGANISM="Pseudo-nitzschia australis, Strain 10249 10 AB" /LENGTH=206 /DNA_ID=CAMNT_0008088031 /DNA_START=129 /DNA_END=749 /DNA_ORIENTATION=+